MAKVGLDRLPQNGGIQTVIQTVLLQCDGIGDHFRLPIIGVSCFLRLACRRIAGCREVAGKLDARIILISGAGHRHPLANWTGGRAHAGVRVLASSFQHGQTAKVDRVAVDLAGPNYALRHRDGPGSD